MALTFKFPPKRILVPVVHDALSLKAWRFARDLAQRFGGEAKALYVETPPPVESAPYYWQPTFALPQRRDLRREFRRIIGPYGLLEVTEGDPVVCILRVARTWKADMIVMGTHGRRGVGRFLLGSITEAVMRNAPVPVLALRRPPSQVRSVVAPVNFRDYSEFGFTYAASVAAALGARLTLQYVDPKPDIWFHPGRELELMIKRLPENVRKICRPKVVLSEGAAVAGIAREAKRNDLAVVVEHKQGLIKDALNGTTAEAVIRAGAQALLSVPAPTAATPLYRKIAHAAKGAGK